MAHQLPPEPEKDRSERWLLTYSDLITLLLIFFIVLYTISKYDVAKFKQIAASLSSALSGSKYVISQSPGPSIIPLNQGLETVAQEGEITEEKRMEAIKKKVENLIKNQGLEASVSVTLEERGIAIRIVDRVLFRSGSADLTPQAYQILLSIGKILKTNNTYYIRIEGHTDNVPISNEKFPSNWELSAARATNVLRLFIDKLGMNPKLLSEVGYGEFRPIADNTTEKGRSKNRRVEIVILRSKFNLSESQSTQP